MLASRALSRLCVARNTSMLRGIARLHRVTRNTSMLRGIARHPSMLRSQDTHARQFSTTTAAEEEDIDVDAVAYAFMGSKALFAALELGLFDVVARRGDAQGSKRERNSQLQRLLSRPFSTRFG